MNVYEKLGVHQTYLALNYILPSIIHPLSNPSQSTNPPTPTQVVLFPHILSLSFFVPQCYKLLSTHNTQFNSSLRKTGKYLRSKDVAF